MENTLYVHQAVPQHPVCHDGKRNKHKISERVKIDSADRRDIHHSKKGYYQKRKKNVPQLEAFRNILSRFQTPRKEIDKIEHRKKTVRAEYLKRNASLRAVSPGILVETVKIIVRPHKDRNNSAEDKRKNHNISVSEIKRFI
jgi:hypothetical protein